MEHAADAIPVDDLVIKPELTIFRASHTFLVRDWEGNMSSYSDDEPVALLWAIADQLCDMGNRYSASRLRIVYAPGDKHHDLHPQPCATCDCGCDPDRSTPDD